MDVSVVVPLFNVKDYIEICIQALLKQDYPQDRYEIIMVDNNSTDETSEIVSRFSRIRLLSEPKQGSYAARNRGIAVSEGDVIAFTDPDCQPHLDWLSSIVKSMRQPGRGIVLGRREFGSKSRALTMMADYESAKADYVFSSGIKEIYYGHTNNMAVLKPLLEKLGNFLEIDRGADTVFVRKVVDILGCEVVHFTPEACVRHLEVLSIRDFYKKKMIYGRSNEGNRSVGSASPLDTAKRLEIFGKTVREQKYSLRNSCQLFMLLVLGLFYYEFGRWRAR